MNNCPTCGASESFLVPVWEDMDDYSSGDNPDYLGCTECHTMTEISSLED